MQPSMDALDEQLKGFYDALRGASVGFCVIARPSYFCTNLLPYPEAQAPAASHLQSDSNNGNAVAVAR